jgi:hypothetical protein
LIEVISEQNAHKKRKKKQKQKKKLKNISRSVRRLQQGGV